MIALLVLAGVLLRQVGPGALHALHSNVLGALMLVVAGGLMTAVGLPRQVLAFSGGFVFGALGGFWLAMAGQMLGCALDYTAARIFIGAWAHRRIAGRWRRLDSFIAAQPFIATLTLRLLPVGNNLALNLLAGVTEVDAARFLAGSALGYVPQTLIFALLGSGVQLGKLTQLAAGLALFLASGVLGVVLWRRGRDTVPENAPGA
jgi:uncharacterized membrane protein YdjX (TVP38/TMEM64 family)